MNFELMLVMMQVQSLKNLEKIGMFKDPPVIVLHNKMENNLMNIFMLTLTNFEDTIWIFDNPTGIKHNISS